MPSLSDVSLVIVDCEHKTAPTQGHGIPSIRTTNIRNGRLDLESANRVSEETYQEWTARMEPREGDLILAREAPVGEVGIVPASTRVCLGQRTVLVRPDREKAVPRYLLYLLLTPQIQHELSARSEGSTTPHLNVADIREFKLPELPGLRDQERIAHILGTLDDKIELNRRMNCTLEAIARAIFKSWFIDFDPVHAKAEGREPVGMEPETAALFPDSFQDSPLGKIPEGWEVSTVGDEFRLTMGQSPPGSTYNEDGVGLPFFQGRRDFGFRFPTRRVFCTAPKRVAEGGDALVSVRAPVGDVNMALEKLCVGRGLAAVRHVSGSRSYTYCAMLSLRERFREFESEGTVFGAINKGQFAGLEWVDPGVGVVKAFEERLCAVDESIRLNELESMKLASARDTLLPKLLSGELREEGFP